MAYAIEIKTNTLKEQFTISGNGKQVRDLYLKASQKIKGQAFNIGGGMQNSSSLLETELDGIYTRESDQRVFVADISKAKQLIGWEPKKKMIE